MQKKYNIDILSFTITVDGKSYVERVDFTNEQYYDMLTKCTDIPKTSQITMMRFEEQFEAYLAAGIEDVLYVSINSGGSNTHSAALMARQNFLEAHPGCPMHITIVDSHTYSMTYGWFVCEAAKKLAGGADMRTVVEYLEDAFARMEVALSVFTLRFIKKSGRISAAAAFAGELLGLRPIITMIDGETATAAKVRGDNAVMPALVAHVKSALRRARFTWWAAPTKKLQAAGQAVQKRAWPRAGNDFRAWRRSGHQHGPQRRGCGVFGRKTPLNTKGGRPFYAEPGKEAAVLCAKAHCRAGHCVPFAGFRRASLFSASIPLH